MYNTTPLPLINNSYYSNPYQNTNTFANSLPQSLAHNYFQYAKNTMKYGDLHNIPQTSNSMSFHPYHSAHQMALDPDPYHQLYQREGMVYRRLQNNNLVSSFTLPQINHNNSNEIRDGEIVHFPQSTLVPLSHVDHYVKRNKKGTNEPLEAPLSSTQADHHHLGKQIGRMNEFRKKNLKKWAFIRSVVHMISLYKSMKTFTKISLDIKGNKFLHIQSAKESLTEIRTFLLPCLGNLEMFCVQFFHSAIRYNTVDLDKQKNSVFIVKSFIHQLFSDLTAAFARNEDIPGKIRKLFRLYISEGVTLPHGFLSTFEFNRLEFDLKVRLIHMTKERKGMMVCFILLYRVLLIDIFKRHFSYFPNIQAMEPNEERIEEELTRRVHQGERRPMMRHDLVGNDVRTPPRNRIENDEMDSYDERRENSRLHSRRREEHDEREDNDDRRKNSRSHSRRREDNDDRRGNSRSHSRKRRHDEMNDLSNRKVSFERKEGRGRGEGTRRRREEQQRGHRKGQDAQKRSTSGIKPSENNHYPQRQKSTKRKPPPNPPKRSQTQRPPSKKRVKKPNEPHRNQSQSKSKSHLKEQRRKLPNINHNPLSKRNNTRTILEGDLGDRRYMKKKEDGIDEEEQNFQSRSRVQARPNKLKESIRKDKKKKLCMKISHNFNFLINILHHIFHSTFLENIDMYADEFKQRHCCKLMVYRKEGEAYTKSDDIELIKGVVLNTKVTDDFIRQNDRWIQMYKLNTYQFCCDFARKVMKE